jgi:hypothetical protein
MQNKNGNYKGLLGVEEISDVSAYIRKNNLKGIAWLKFRTKIYLYFLLTYLKLLFTIIIRKCYYGPFKGEFGHMLAHTAPFLMYLHKKGVKIVYCGMELHAPILVDNTGTSIIYDYRPLRDFFHEVQPKGNEVQPPDDVQKEIMRFEKEGRSSFYPFWNIGNAYYYFFIHRNFLNKSNCHVYNLKSVYQSDRNIKAVSVFPRSKGAKVTPNNGGPWDYQKVIDLVKPYVDMVYVIGHPAQSVAIAPQDKVEVCITADNRIVLEKCANSQLIITQHSGVVYLGDYFDIDVLVIYNGEQPIKGIGDTIRFKQNLHRNRELNFAFSYGEIENYLKNKFA